MQVKRKPIAQGVRFNVLRRDNFTCRYCGRSSPQVVLQVDHVIPHSRGGHDGEGNLVTACEDCNRGKAAKPDILPPGFVFAPAQPRRKPHRMRARRPEPELPIDPIFNRANEVRFFLGDRVRLKRGAMPWMRGADRTGTYLYDGTVVMDGLNDEGFPRFVDALDDQWALLPDQAAWPAHADQMTAHIREWNPTRSERKTNHAQP